MSNSRIKDLSERNTLTSGDYFVTDNNSGTRKVDVNKVLNPISDAQTTADNVAKKVSKSSDAFSSSKGYSVGELCIYNNKVYRCKTSYSTGASWASRSTYFEEVSLVDAVSDLNNDLQSVNSSLYNHKTKVIHYQGSPFTSDHPYWFKCDVGSDVNIIHGISCDVDFIVSDFLFRPDSHILFFQCHVIYQGTMTRSASAKDFYMTIYYG